MVYLENEFIKAGFCDRGAELQELINKKNNENYLWKGDPAFWGKFSPVLFPIVGGLKDDTYTYDSHSYHLSRHGFARDKQFRIQSFGERELLFTLSEDPDTLAVFPFKFRLGIRYLLSGSTLECKYEVFNPDHDTDLLFSIGAHPAFAIPTTSNELSYSDYFLEFNRDNELTYHKIESDLITEQTENIPLNKGKLRLNYDLFYNDALVFKSLRSDQIKIGNTKNSNGVTFSFDSFPYFGIWAAKDADFICLEPWCGIADLTGHDQKLSHKEGILKLEPKMTFTKSWNVSVF